MATNTVNVNFKLKADDKRLMESACRELGLSMSAAFTIFAKKVGRERRIPFEVSADPFYSEENLSRLKKTIDEVEAGRKQLVPHDLIEE
ncbi:type II toxin-antitoxin system RelB/DinJ family antitoxin [Varibaculum cambriense]|uniref:type II toxin-antitoxin system RelB/DinJ family antitoxin n=1 Tax=Varibaculum cambriense TaxID=184870 RepID=UPI000427D25B|nr:type II toxin-antitoxin system RelB/DinJ family antitoxin [Varibaculum cambriense]MDU4245144.1 type II toxin-antitoxin system RelB/DinJ family antitoxin [Varibaculum cambriense]MDU7408071.1 type II toxin-antitoxin system RelB/DinJ family antitoxin [Varibaculum cambriense]